MKSQTFQLKSIAPVAVALSLTLAMSANAQTTSSPADTPRMIASAPIGTASGTTPVALLQSQEPVIDPAEFSTVTKIAESKVADSKGWETAAEGSQPTATKPEAASTAVSENTPASKSENTVSAAPVSESATTEKAVDVPMERITADSASSRSIEKTESAVDVTPDLKPIAVTETPSTTPATDLTDDAKAIASSTDVADGGVQLRGAPDTASTRTDTAGDTSQLRQIDIAQSSPNDATTSPSPDNREFDLTPVSLPRRTPTFNRFEGFHSNMLYALPGRMFFSAVVDNSLRAETNVFQTKNHNRTDMVYRVLPNTVLGWALTRKTRVSANYFFLRDQYTKYQLLDRNFHSVCLKVEHDLYNQDGLTVTGGFLARALFANPDQFSDAFFNDLLPSLTVTKQVGNHAVVYGSVVGQIRFREVLSQFQEGDQFYSVGTVYKKGPWQALGDFTLNNNFGNSNLRQGDNNQVIILTEEIARRLPYLRKVPIDAYIRAQQIFNMGANNSPGYAGVNCRIFGGIRAYVSKPVVYPVKLAGK